MAFGLEVGGIEQSAWRKEGIKSIKSSKSCLKVMQKNNLISIQEVSALLKVPKPTLRFWEKELEGILVPVRTRGGQRRYSDEQISIIHEIKKMRSKGISLPEIKRKLSNGDRGDSSNSKRVDLLADRVAEVVRTEISRFFEGTGNELE